MRDRGRSSNSPRRPPSAATFRRRRLTALIGLLSVAAVCLGVLMITADADAPAPQLTTARVEGLLPARPIASSFLGISLEYTAVIPYASVTGLDPVFIQLVRQLDPGQTPILRIGGDTTDWSWVPVPGTTPPAGIRYTITPTWLTAVGSLVHALGARAIFGINLEADNLTEAAAEANAFRAAVGPSSLAAFEVGNEPELYGKLSWYQTLTGRRVKGRSRSYGISAYTTEFSRFASAIGDTALAGPATGAVTWMDHLSTFLRRAPQVAYVTVHRYPLSCYAPPGTAKYPSLSNLTLPSSSSGLAASVVPAVAAAHANHMQLRVDELNSVACKGKAGVSDTFGSALWMLDTLFDMASVGVDGVNVHTLPDSWYHPFARIQTATGAQWVVDPDYYGMLAFANVATPGSQFLSITAKPPAGVRLWAVRSPDGQTKIVAINEYPTQPENVNVEIPGVHAAGSLTWLRAPSINATSDVTFGGETFGTSTRNGLLDGSPRSSDIVPTAHGYRLDLPPASAAILSIGRIPAGNPYALASSRRN